MDFLSSHGNNTKTTKHVFTVNTTSLILMSISYINNTTCFNQLWAFSVMHYHKN